AVGRNAVTGGRRTTSSRSPMRTPIVTLEWPPLSSSVSTGPSSTPSTFFTIQARSASGSASDIERFAQLALQNLAAAVSRELFVDQPHVCRHLERRETSTYVTADIVFVHGGSISDANDRADLFAKSVVRDADDGRLGDVGVLVKCRFDFGGVDVLA